MRKTEREKERERNRQKQEKKNKRKKDREGAADMSVSSDIRGPGFKSGRHRQLLSEHLFTFKFQLFLEATKMNKKGPETSRLNKRTEKERKEK